MQPDRRLRLGNVFNLRDLGGYVGEGGRVTRWRTLWRADGLQRLDDADRQAVAALGLRTIVDLRTHGEQADWGVAPHRQLGARLMHRPLIAELWSHDSVEPDHDPVQYLVERYHEMLDEGSSVLAEIVELVAHDPEATPLVFHCSAGKDRTGVTAAVLLGLAGVDHHTIAADYHLTAEAMTDLLAWLRATHPDATDTMADQPPTWVMAPIEAMDRLLVELTARWGSVPGYVEAIGVDAATVDAFRDRILEPR